MKETKITFPLIMLIVAMVVLIPSLKMPKGEVGGAVHEVAERLPKSEDIVIATPHINPDHEDLKTLGASVLVTDVASNVVLFTKNSDEIRPIASLTKLVSALVAWNWYLNNPEDNIVTIQPEDIDVVSYRAGLYAGEEIGLPDLIQAMLVSSANDAALAVARHVGGTVPNFVSEMNDYVADLGLTDTHFANPVGFDHPEHYSKANDLAVIIREVMKYPELIAITGIKETSVSAFNSKVRHYLKNTNQLLYEFPTVVGMKTGYTTEAKGNLALLVQDDTKTYFIVILGSPNREADARAIIKWVEGNFEWN